MRPFGEAQNKAMRAYAQSGQYHTIVESRVRLTLNCIFLGLYPLPNNVCDVVDGFSNKRKPRFLRVIQVVSVVVSCQVNNFLGVELS